MVKIDSFKKPETVSNSEWNWILTITAMTRAGIPIGTGTLEKYNRIEAKIKSAKK